MSRPLRLLLLGRSVILVRSLPWYRPVAEGGSRWFDTKRSQYLCSISKAVFQR